MGVTYSVCSLRSNLVVQPAADKSFYSWLTGEKMHAFAVFNDKYLRPYKHQYYGYG